MGKFGRDRINEFAMAHDTRTRVGSTYATNAFPPSFGRTASACRIITCVLSLVVAPQLRSKTTTRRSPSGDRSSCITSLAHIDDSALVQRYANPDQQNAAAAHHSKHDRHHGLSSRSHAGLTPQREPRRLLGVGSALLFG